MGTVELDVDSLGEFGHLDGESALDLLQDLHVLVVGDETDGKSLGVESSGSSYLGIRGC